MPRYRSRDRRCLLSPLPPSPAAASPPRPIGSRDASRKAGDITAEVNSGETGYNVVVFLSRDDNHYNTVSVRHIPHKG